MNNIDFLIKQQSVYTTKQKEFFKKKNLKIDVEDYKNEKIQVVTSPNKSTKYILQMFESEPQQVCKALNNQFMIEILELKDCRLKVVPAEIFKMHRLKILKLDGNFIKVAPVIEVEVLSFRNNLLLHYQCGQKVKRLDLSQNKLQEFNLGQSLEELSVVANEFTILPKLPKTIKQLELDWFKYVEPELSQVQFQPLIMPLTETSVACIDFLKMFSKAQLTNKIIQAALAQDLGVLASFAQIMDVNIQETSGETALSLALKTDNLFSVRHLIELGSNIELGTYHQGSILSYALDNNLPSIVNLIFSKLKITSFGVDIYGNSPLHYLCRFEYDDISGKIIIKAKTLHVPMNKNIYGLTPIHLAISKSKNWLLSIMMKYYRVDSDDLFSVAVKSDNLGAILLLINQSYTFEDIYQFQNCRNLKILRILRNYEKQYTEYHLKKALARKQLFTYEVKLLNKYRDNIDFYENEFSLDESQSQATRSSNYIKLLRQYILFKQMHTKQQKQHILFQLIQRVRELATTNLDQLIIISDILLTLFFGVDQLFFQELIKYQQYIQIGQQYLFKYFQISNNLTSQLLQYEQFQS